MPQNGAKIEFRQLERVIHGSLSLSKVQSELQPLRRPMMPKSAKSAFPKEHITDRRYCALAQYLTLLIFCQECRAAQERPGRRAVCGQAPGTLKARKLVFHVPSASTSVEQYRKPRTQFSNSARPSSSTNRQLPQVRNY